MAFGNLREFLQWYWRQVVIVLTPLLLLPLLIVLGSHSEARCGYVILIMIVFWMTEALPLGITALIPVLGFPLLGIISTKELCPYYMMDSNILLFGGLVFATAIEFCNLDKRIALFVLLRLGKNPRLLMGGFMITTALLSMWINNAAAASIMLPTLEAVLDELDEKWKLPKDMVIPQITITDMEDNQVTLWGETNNGYKVDPDSDSDSDSEVDQEGSLKKSSSGNLSVDMETDLSGESPKLCSPCDSMDFQYEEPKKDPNDFDIDKFRRCVYLSVAYSASIGGTGTMIGSPPNLLFLGLLNKDFGDTDINFGTWLAFNLPGLIICLLIAWIWLQYLYLGISRPESDEEKVREAQKKARIIMKVVRSKYKALGKVSFYEWTVLGLGFLLMVLWVFRKPGNLPGWANIFENMYDNDTTVSDSTSVILIIILLFTIPASFDSPNDAEEKEVVQRGRSIRWSYVQRRFPWEILLLVGGGFALAEGANRSKLSVWIGSNLKGAGSLPVVILVLFVTIVTTAMTNVVSNNATAAILLPVLEDLSLTLCCNPLYLMLPAVICCAFAFMLPVATPPNAVIYAAGKLSTKEMIKAGLGMNIICICVLNLMINTLGVSIFDLNKFPSWANTTTLMANQSC